MLEQLSLGVRGRDAACLLPHLGLFLFVMRC